MPRKLRLEFSGACYHVTNRQDENQPIPARFAFLGADGQATREARMVAWEERLRCLATAFGISLDRLPSKKSASEKLVLAAALKRTTSVSIAWLAQRLEMGAPDSVGSLLHRFRVSGGMEEAQFKDVLSRFDSAEKVSPKMGCAKMAGRKPA